MAKLPASVRSVLETLEEGGHEAVLVGGCVRDMLRGVRPHDWDVATSARPEQVTDLFARTVPTGLRHGTVTVLIGRARVEVTTYRAESGYSDGRHPDSLRFVTALETDLARRDFTINAMALDLRGALADPFGGREDLEGKILRCVGDAMERFSEDGLRLFRLVRFESALGFEAEEQTEEAFVRCAHMAESIAAERIRDEVSRVLLSKRPQKLEKLFRCGMMDRFVLTPAPEVHLGALRWLPPRLDERFAALAALLVRAGALEEAEGFAFGLRLPSALCRAAGRAAGYALGHEPPGDEGDWKRLLRRMGFDTARCCAAVWRATGRRGAPAELVRVYNLGECWEMARLALSGWDLVEMGFAPGPEVGEALERLLDHVIDHPRDNTREALLSMALLMKATQN